ncbi:MAG: hypothetical protein ABS881_09575, partial [Psychrobacter alimentarius]
ITPPAVNLQVWQVTLGRVPDIADFRRDTRDIQVRHRFNILLHMDIRNGAVGFFYLGLNICIKRY